MICAPTQYGLYSIGTTSDLVSSKVYKVKIIYVVRAVFVIMTRAHGSHWAKLDTYPRELASTLAVPGTYIQDSDVGSGRGKDQRQQPTSYK